MSKAGLAPVLWSWRGPRLRLLLFACCCLLLRVVAAIVAAVVAVAASAVPVNPVVLVATAALSAVVVVCQCEVSPVGWCLPTAGHCVSVLIADCCAMRAGARSLVVVDGCGPLLV